jgi:hypothetical protein
MMPCDAFEPGDANANTMVRAFEGPIAAVAMKDAFLLRNVCDGANGECRVDKVALPELSAGSQVMLTTAGRFLVGIDHERGDVWTYELRGAEISREPTYVDERGGPGQLVIGLRDSDRLIVRDREDRLAVYEPGKQMARPIAADLGAYLRLAAVGEHHVAVKVPNGDDGSQRLYVVDVDAPERYRAVATGTLTSVVFGPGDASLVVSEGRGADASVLVFDVAGGALMDAFAGDLVSSHEQNDHRALEEVPGLHALAPGGDELAYRTTAGSLAVRQLGQQSSCLVRNTNRLGTGEEPSRRAGNHALAGFGADGMMYAEYTVGASDSFVYAYDPRHQQITPLGAEDGDWHLAAVPGRVTDDDGDPERLWAPWACARARTRASGRTGSTARAWAASSPSCPWTTRACGPWTPRTRSWACAGPSARSRCAAWPRPRGPTASSASSKGPRSRWSRIIPWRGTTRAPCGFP